MRSEQDPSRVGITPKSWTAELHRGVLHLGKRWYVVSAELDEHGNAVHHIGVSTGARLETSVRALEEMGARRVLGRPGDSYAHMELRRDLGLVLALSGRPA